MRHISLGEFEEVIELLVRKIAKKKTDPFKPGSLEYTGIFGVPRGGVPVAIALSHAIGIPLVESSEADLEYGPGCSKSILVVDDLVDSGATRLKYKDQDFAVLCIKNTTPKEAIPTYFVTEENEWIEFFWEVNEAPATDAVTRLIEYIGEDPSREGLIETPSRVIKAYDFMFSGYKQNPKDIIKTFASDGYDQIVLLKNIEIYSMCEHHILPFWGQAHVAYIPKDRVIGISKLARLVDLFSRRLQIQERIGEQVTSTLMDLMQPVGAACVIEASHLCMRMRGVEKQNSVMTTSSLKGVFLEDSEKGRASREELMGLIK